MTFTGSENHSISLEEASKLTTNYRKNTVSGAVLAGFFGKEVIQAIIDQSECVGIRVYYGQQEDGTPELVLVGAKSDMDDIIDGKLAEKMIPCPPNCGSANDLNTE